jgi:hypothetical protein
MILFSFGTLKLCATRFSKLVEDKEDTLQALGCDARGLKENTLDSVRDAILRLRQ